MAWRGRTHSRARRGLGVLMRRLGHPLGNMSRGRPRGGPGAALIRSPSKDQRYGRGVSPPSIGHGTPGDIARCASWRNRTPDARASRRYLPCSDTLSDVLGDAMWYGRTRGLLLQHDHQADPAHEVRGYRSRRRLGCACRCRADRGGTPPRATFNESRESLYDDGGLSGASTLSARAAAAARVETPSLAKMWAT